MPPVTNPADIYAADRPNQLADAVRGQRQLVYVPNSKSNTVDVIDPRTYRIIDHFKVGRLPQHVTPSWDLKTLYVLNDMSNTVQIIDPRTGKLGRTLQVADPYNMYFTPDGKHAIVVAERLQRLDFRDPHTMRLTHSLHVSCRGIDHADFTADGRFAVFSCEFSGQLVKVDIARESVVGYLHVKEGGSPQDVKTSPDGKVMYVADQYADGVQLIDPVRFKEIGFIKTGRGTHGLYVSRDSRYLYVTNRHDQSVSLIDLRTRRVHTKWHIAGMTPDMGGVSADGRVLWLSGRYDGHVWAIDTTTGRALAKIRVGREPHGLCVWPQPGRYSLGHTGVLR
jgi:YVTN family beta-propeller protein